ncbi:asparagine synthetase A [Paludifilum halophilum]|uniref:Asparaginase n=1 Tax=Paludifilum halophilum TaxID=1642702 RepID=A0A235B769_9BACL|nr:asparagine synthetase A [Paludifilum halophilum]OYD08153.1 asparaginase [Paludifilum halophilum]
MKDTIQKLMPTKSWADPTTHYKVALKSEWYKTLAIIQDEINHSTWNFFRDQGIRTVSLPITTGSITSPMGLGSDSLPVKVELEGVETYLSDSMQFHLEYMLRYLPEGVHYIMPSFRGELADERHLCQFYHSESEIVGGLYDVIQLVNRYIYRLCEDLLKHTPAHIKKMAGTTEHLEQIISKNRHIPEISFEEAVKQLNNDSDYIVHHPEGFRTITPEGEKNLIKQYGGMVWLTHHDYLSVPFYQTKDKTGKYALNADLLFGIGEVVGAGERHKTGNQVRESMRLHELNEKEYEWYVYMKDYFPMQTAGFGMGLERLLMWIAQQDDIRDFQIIPRFNGVTITP